MWKFLFFIFFTYNTALAQAISKEDFNVKIKAIHAMPQKTDMEQAKRCKALADFYKQYSKAKFSLRLGGGEAPSVTETGIASLTIPDNFQDMIDEEQNVILNCQLAKHLMETSYTVATRVAVNTLNAGFWSCDTCNPLQNSALVAKVSQKLDDGSYQINMLSIDMGRGFKSHSLGRSILLKTDRSLKPVNQYIFGVFAGFEKVQMINGFDKKVPVLVDIGVDGATAIFARFQQIKTAFLQHPSFKNTTSCVQLTFSENNFYFTKLGCVPKNSKYKTAILLPEKYPDNY